jgi:hypothetical protein
MELLIFLLLLELGGTKDYSGEDNAICIVNSGVERSSVVG